MASSIIKNVFAKGILNLFSAVVPLLLVPYIYRVFPPEVIGKIEYATTLYTYFSLIGLFGIYNYGLREVSKFRFTDEHLTKVTFVNLFHIGAIVNTACFVLYNIFIKIFIDNIVTLQIAFILGFNLIAQIFYVEWINEAYEKFRFITIKTIIIRVVSLLFIFSIIREPSDYKVYVLITVLVLFFNNIVSFISTIYLLNLSIRSFFEGIKIKPYILPLTMIMILNNSNILYTMVDRTFLGAYSSPEELAYYGVGQKVVDMVKSLLLPIAFVALPRLSSYLVSSREQYQEKILMLMRFILLIAIPSSVGLFLLSDEIIYIFAGQEYLPSITSFRIFAIRLIFLAIDFIIYNQIIFLHGKEKILLSFNIICGGINLLIKILLGNNITPVNAIATTLSCEILFQILCLLYIHYKLTVKTGVFSAASLRYIVYTISFFPIILIVKSLFDNLFVVCVLSICICSIAYFLQLYLFKDKMFATVFNRLFNKS